jgi:hypothetical protein
MYPQAGQALSSFPLLKRSKKLGLNPGLIAFWDAQNTA